MTYVELSGELDHALFNWLKSRSHDLLHLSVRAGHGDKQAQAQLGAMSLMMAAGPLTDGPAAESEEMPALELGGVKLEETLTTEEMLQEAANRAIQALGPGRGAAYGSRVHAEFAEQIEALGNPNLFTEQSYLNGRPVPYGTPGSIRIDVGEGTIELPTAVYDLKTGGAELSARRIQELRSQLPEPIDGRDIGIKQIKPSNN